MVTLPNSKLIICLLRGQLHGPTFSFVWNLPTNYLSIGLGALLFELKRQEKREPSHIETLYCCCCCYYYCYYYYYYLKTGLFWRPYSATYIGSVYRGWTPRIRVELAYISKIICSVLQDNLMKTRSIVIETWISYVHLFIDDAW